MYIHHPNEIPLHYRLQQGTPPHRSQGEEWGLRFAANEPIPPGSSIEIEIQLPNHCVHACGRVAWCDPCHPHYEVGVCFDDPQTRFMVRMMEQVCQIEGYRERMRRQNGRSLSREQAALEWIDHHAASFPSVTG